MSATVSLVPATERKRAIGTLVSAFVADPVLRWLYPDAHQYLAHFPAFIQAFGGRAFDEQTAWHLGNFAAVSFWLPPGAEADGDAIVKVLSETVSPTLHDDLFAVLGQMTEAHPTDPHWYLPWFGVDAVRQGSGLGSQLLASCLTVVDAAHQPSYLESTNPRNIPFYERHGFVVVGNAQAGSFPPMVLMGRPVQ